ncbi:MAG: 50S ribosomal protein L3 [Nanoarchaeota archaeon]
MADMHSPRHGSIQFWPRKRSKHSLARIRYWAKESKTKPLGFIGYKAGMTHLLVTDNRPKALTKGEIIQLASTILDCPPMAVAGVCFYKNGRKLTTMLVDKLPKELARNFQLPKKAQPMANRLDNVKEFDDLRLLVHTNPKLTSISAKKPKLMEIALGGSKEEKLNFAKGHLDKEIKIEEVFASGNSVDIHGITKGKGFQGTVKRFGVPIRQHKAEKTKRGIGTLGPWHPNRVRYSVPQSGKMGYHLRTEYNKQILKIGSSGKEITPDGGITKYGLLNNNYVLIKGSVMGPKKRAVVLVPSIRPNPKMTKDAPQISYVSVKS